MSKKLMTALDEASLPIYANTYGSSLPEEIINDLVDRMIAEKIQKFLNFSSAELDKAYVIIGRDIHSLRETQLKARQQGADLDQEELYELTNLNVKMKILEAAIESRKEARAKKGEHPILHKHVDFPVFSVDKPKKATLEKMQKRSGIIMEKRDGGYRQLYFMNANGTLLTDYDHKVFSSLCKVCVDKGTPKELRVEIREIVEEMKIANPGGGDYQSVRDSLLDIYNTSLVFEDAITDFDEDASFEYHRIFQSFSAKGKKFSSFTILLQDYIHQALQNGEFFNINMHLMNDLSLDVAKSLYKFILNEYSREEKEIYQIEFKKLHSHIDKDRNNANRAHIAIKKGFQELLESGIIASWEDVRIGTGNWMYYVTPNKLQLQYAARSVAAGEQTEAIQQVLFT